MRLKERNNSATGPVLSNPCDLLSIPSASKPRDRVVTRAELQLLLGAMTPAMAIVTELAYETAMRRSEILKITPNDLHLNARYLRVVNGKEGSRDVPLTRRAVELLETPLELRNEHDHCFLLHLLACHKPSEGLGLGWGSTMM